MSNFASTVPKFSRANFRCVVAAGVFLIVAASGVAHAEMVIFADNFHADDGDFDAASLSNRISGLDASHIVPQSAVIPQAIAANQLQLVAPGADGSGGTAGLRFTTAEDKSTLWDWSSGDGGPAIIKAGGMRISFNWTAADSTSSDWIYVAVGADSADSYGYQWKMLATSTATSAGLIFANDGNVKAFNAGTVNTTGTFVPDNPSHTVMLDYQFDSWEVGAPVMVTVFVDGKYVLTDSFEWLYGAGSQYISIGTYQEKNIIDSFKIATFNGTISSGFSPKTFVNTGEFPDGPHEDNGREDNGTEWYSPTNTSGQPCVTMSNNILTLTAYHMAHEDCHYQSGVVYCNTDVPNRGYKFVTLDVDMNTPDAGTTGCWPSFWLESAWDWPPEIDVAEFKGDKDSDAVSQNVVGSDHKWVFTSSAIDKDKWHHYSLLLGPPASGARTYQMFIDGAVKAQGSFEDKQGVPFYVIFNYAMEGSAGEPGPTETSFIQAKNWKMAIH